MTTIYWFCYNLWLKCFQAFFSYRVVGKEKLVTEGPVLIASNHESFLDPPLVGVAYDQEVHYLARKTLFRGFGAWLYPRLNSIPVDQDRPDMTSLKTVIKRLKEGKKVVVFPEGARTLDGELQEGQPGTGLIVAKSKAIVQPVRIFGARDALPRGSGKIKFCPITLVIGDPIVFTEEELKVKGKDGYQQISEKIMTEIAKLEL